MRVLVTGSTTWASIDAVRRELSRLPKDTVIVTDDTPGVDAYAIASAHELGLAANDFAEKNPNRWDRLNLMNIALMQVREWLRIETKFFFH